MRMKRKTKRKIKTNVNYKLFDNYIIDEKSYKEHKRLFEYIYDRYKERLKDEDFNIDIERCNLKKRLNNKNNIPMAVNFMLLINMIIILSNRFFDYLPKGLLEITTIIIFINAIRLIINRFKKENNYEWLIVALEVLEVLEKEKTTLVL